MAVRRGGRELGVSAWRCAPLCAFLARDVIRGEQSVGALALVSARSHRHTPCQFVGRFPTACGCYRRVKASAEHTCCLCRTHASCARAITGSTTAVDSGPSWSGVARRSCSCASARPRLRRACTRSCNSERRAHPPAAIPVGVFPCCARVCTARRVGRHSC